MTQHFVQHYTEDEALSLIREHCREHGGQTRLAARAGVSGAYVSQWRSGTTRARRLPDSLLRAIGLRRVTYIERIPSDAH